MPIVEALGLTKKFGSLTAVDDLRLDVEEGEILGFLGPNGAGKTTTIRMLAGIIGPTSGSATVAGLPVDRQVERLHEVIGLLTERPGLYGGLSARRNLEYFAGFYDGLDVRLQVEKYLKAVGLWDRREDRAGTFSKGMGQRLALARALLHEPRVVFLDEPTAGLDPEVTGEVHDLIKALSVKGRTFFISTHNLAEAELLCHRVAVFRTRLLAIDTPEALRRRLFRRRVAVQLQAIDSQLVEALKKLPFVEGIEQDRMTLLAELRDAESNKPDLVGKIVELGGRVTEIADEQHSLEEVYLSLVKDEGKP